MRILAHRGLHLEHPGAPVPENTYAALNAAIAEPRIAGFELDLRLLGDGTPVVFHDADTARIVGTTHDLASLSAPAWRALRADGGHALPTFVEALPVFAAGLLRPDFEVHLELKTASNPRPLVEAIVPGLRQLVDVVPRDATDRLIVSSFDPRIIAELSRIFMADPRLGLALLAHRPAALDALPLLTRRGLAIHADIAWVQRSPELLALWASRGYRVRLWTVDNATALTEVLAQPEPFWPIGLMSDRPLSLAAALSVSHDPHG